MSSAQLIDKEYNDIVADLAAQYRNIEPFLLIKSAMLRRKYPSEKKQHFWLELQYREGTDMDEKSTHVFGQVGKLPRITVTSILCSMSRPTWIHCYPLRPTKTSNMFQKSIYNKGDQSMPPAVCTYMATIGVTETCMKARIQDSEEKR